MDDRQGLAACSSSSSSSRVSRNMSVDEGEGGGGKEGEGGEEGDGGDGGDGFPSVVAASFFLYVVFCVYDIMSAFLNECVAEGCNCRMRGNCGWLREVDRESFHCFVLQSPFIRSFTCSFARSTTH
eukprot:GHVU01148695.1.p2 GENE.GHVU01148695.1~~GHVU01148695.1.p2  ORF type:complete len:126 (+),score=26.54 GHVU01148695.1:994-1371(+)